MATVLRHVDGAIARKLDVGPAAVTIGDDEEGQPIAALAIELSRRLEADAVQVSWHGDDEAAVILYTDGIADGADARAMTETATIAARERDAAPHWYGIGGDEDMALLATSIEADGGRVTVTSLFRGVGSSARKHVRDAASRLLPIMKPFFRVWSARRRALAQVRGLKAAVNKSDIGLVLVNRDGRVVFTNAAALAMAEQGQGHGLRLAGGMLAASKLADTWRLQAAIEHVVARHGAAPANDDAHVVALTRPGRRPLVAAVLPGDRTAASGDEVAAIIHIVDPEQDLRRYVEPACKLYDLSPAETRFACLLAEGMSLSDAAVALKVREQTARSYLKQIFLKTDTNRQAELVWLMLKSSVRTAGL